MTEWDDHELLAEYARSESEAAFTALVERYVNLVHSAAWRFTGNSHSAEEITQAVFIILARKAGSLRRGAVLSGWLYQTARLTAANFVKGEIRRQRREQEAYMQSTLNEPDAVAWEQIAPLLDEAMGQLGETDRNAVVLRFFENKTASEVGAALKLTEAAAHKRVNRALEKLRKVFMKRGVALTAVAIAGTVSANSVQAAPAGLSATVAAAAAKGTTLSATLTTLVKGTMKTMTWIKLKFAAGVGVAALLAGGVATVAVSQTGGGDDPAAQAIVGKARDAYAGLSSYSDNGTVVSEIAGQNVTTTFNIRLQRPNLYRIDWSQEPALNKGAAWSGGSGDYFQVAAADYLMLAARQKKNDQPQKMPNMKTALAQATPLSGFAASTIPGTFFNQTLGDFVAPALSGRYPLKKEKDAMVGDADCYVVSSGMIDLSKIPDIGKPGTVSTTLWIGKKDFLIRQSRMRYVEKTDSGAPTDKAIDEAIKTSLKMQNKPATPEAIAAMRPQMKEIMKQVQATLKSSFESGVVYTQTHENIVVNEKLPPSDFTQ